MITSPVLTDVLFALIMATSGLLAGWWLRSRPAASRPEGESERERHAREALVRLQELAKHIAGHVGAHSSRVEEINQELISAGGKETETVVSAVAKLIGANQQMQQQLASAEQRLEEQARLAETHAAEARTDALTGLANRRALDDELARRCAEFRRRGRAFSVVMVDIDHFKRFNDAHGHQAGDEVLQGVAKVLRSTAREMDTVARYGGEEFLLILPETPAHDVQEVVRRLCKAVESAKFRSGAGELQVTISLGAAAATAGEDAAGLVGARMRRSMPPRRRGATAAIGTTARRIIRSPIARSRRSKSRRRRKSPSRLQHRQRPRNSATAASLPPRWPAAWPSGAAAAPCRLWPWCGLTIGRAFSPVRGSRRPWRPGTPRPSFCRRAVREMDVVAKYADTSFALLLPGASVTDLLHIADRIRQTVAGSELAGPAGPFTFTVSVAAATPMKSDETQVFLWRAEEALDTAQKAGGNCCYFHNGQRPETSAAALQQAGAPVA